MRKIITKSAINRTITPEKAKEILEKYGTEVTAEQVKLILDFMYKFAILTVKQIVRQKNSDQHGDKKPQ